jgi:hypothetical protein
MNRFKSIFAFFFLLAFVFNIVIYYTVFEFDESSAKSEMVSTIGRMQTLDGTECFTLPLTRLHDCQQSELWLNGKLYDIVKTEVTGNSVTVYVLNDKKEECLVQKLGKDTEEQTDAAVVTGKVKHPVKHLTKPASQKYFPAAIISFRYDAFDNRISCVINCFYTTPVPSILAPPPEPLS